MTDVKPFSLGDRYYPDNKEKLEETIKQLFMEVPTDYSTTTRLILVPHAAYEYDGKVVADAFQYFDRDVKTVFIFSPAHYLLFYGIALSSFDKWETPLGQVDVDQEINKEIIDTFDADFNDRAFEKEHAIEVQLPFVQTMAPKAKIVPVLAGHSNFTRIQHIVDKYYFNKDFGFVFSSDMTHTYSMEDALKIDEVNADAIEQKLPPAFIASHSSASNGIIATSEFAREKGYSIIRVALATSGEIAGSDAKVEGYGSWMVVEENKPNFVKREFSDVVLTLCRNSIISGLEYHNPINTDNLKLAPVFDSRASSFVTIKVDGEVRGRSGTAFAYQPLKEDLAVNAFNAAFKKTDRPLSGDEIDKIEIDICLLTRPVPIPYINQGDLMKKINEGDGLIIRNEEKQAALLPCQWEDFQQKDTFIEELKKQAGIDSDFDSKTFEIYRFKVANINSKNVEQ